jgi:hypothetical protein
MKTNLLNKMCIVAVFTAFCTSARTEEIKLEPSKLVPADTGYYIGGAWKDENKDGVKEWYNGCFDAYGDASHNETGTQQGFYYHKCMIMPDCGSKSTQIDPPVTLGYIELTKTKYLGTDSAVMGYIVSPAIKNLVSLFMEASSDVSVQASRPIPYTVEYSKDAGITWELTYFLDNVATEGGYRVTYEKDGLFTEFNEMITASQAGPIKLRIMSGEQRVNIHLLIITAERADVSVPNTHASKPVNLVRINNNTIEAISGSISVYNQMGQLITSGNTVTVKSGLYIVRSINGEVQKVVIE